MNATTLTLDGLLQANGENNWGPTFEEQFGDHNSSRAATGAGGSIQVHVNTLTGEGSIAANGGIACVPASEILGPSYNACTSADADEQSGGGGLVLVVAPTHSGFTGAITANGGAHAAEEKGHPGVVTGP